MVSSIFVQEKLRQSNEEGLECTISLFYMIQDSVS